MSSPLFLGKLMRLGSADAAILPHLTVLIPPAGGFLEIARMMQSPYYDVAPTMPVPGGGIHPATAYEITTLLGKYIMVDVGGGIQGTQAGRPPACRPLQAAVSAAVNGQSLAEKAAQSPALLRPWLPGKNKRKIISSRQIYRIASLQHCRHENFAAVFF